MTSGIVHPRTAVYEAVEERIRAEHETVTKEACATIEAVRELAKNGSIESQRALLERRAAHFVRALELLGQEGSRTRC